MENLVSTKDIIGGKKWLDNIALLFNQLILCRKESGAGEDGHTPIFKQVPGMATKCAFLSLHRKEFKSKT